VAASVAFDSTRAAPEVLTWWGMQHTLYWWHPMLPPQGEFYADGSLGQRIWVQPRTRTITVQFANSNEQDFPFRRIAAAVNGETWRYPRSIPGLVLQAYTAAGIDSARAVFRATTAAMAAHPEAYSMWPQSLRYVAGQAARQGRAADAEEILLWCRERYPSEPSCATPLPSPRRRR
jgi:hypothetical protein